MLGPASTWKRYVWATAHAWGDIDPNAQSTVEAVKFYNEKVEGLGGNLKSLESIVQGKSNNLRVVEDGKCLYVWSISVV